MYHYVYWCELFFLMSVPCLLKMFLMEMAAKLNGLPMSKIAVNVTPSPVNIKNNSSLVL